MVLGARPMAALGGAPSGLPSFGESNIHEKVDVGF
jgi:hypothetical protein